MAYKKTQPLYLLQKIKIHQKIPAGDSNNGPSPTAHQLPQSEREAAPRKTTIGRKGNENLFHIKIVTEKTTHPRY